VGCSTPWRVDTPTAGVPNLDAVLKADSMTPAKRAAWAKYRQALRDIPATVDPMSPEWPDPPG